MAEPNLDAKLLMRARRLYEDTPTPATKIAALLALTPKSFKAHRAEWGWIERRRRRRAAEAEVVREAAEAVRDAPERRRMNVVARVRETVEREIAQVEQSLARMEPLGAQGDPEKAARTLASLVKTLTELQRLDAGATGGATKEADDAVDIDEFRRDLARRLDALCAGGAAGQGAGEPDSGGD